MNAELLTVEEVAGKLRVSQDMIYKFIREEKIPALKLSRKLIRIPKKEFNEFMENSKTGPWKIKNE